MDAPVNPALKEGRLYAAWTAVILAAWGPAVAAGPAAGLLLYCESLMAAAVFIVPAFLVPARPGLRIAGVLLLLPILALPAGLLIAGVAAAPLAGLAAVLVLVWFETWFWYAVASAHRVLYNALVGAAIFLPLMAVITAPAAVWAPAVSAVTPFGLAWHLVRHGWPVPLAAYLVVRVGGFVGVLLLSRPGVEAPADGGKGMSCGS
ncbi:MAG: hypothetical protein ABIF71_08715 [Planctomycetota bacterium]